MTACISPNQADNTKLLDSLFRKVQYLDAIRFYLKESKCNIVFCENSGTDISAEFSSFEQNRLEFLTFIGRERNGKGYGEAKIIEYAIRNSKFIKEAAIIIKITGRIKVRNINDISTSIPQRINKPYVKISFYSSLGLKTSSVCFLATKEWLLNTMAHYIRNFSNLTEKEIENFIFKSIVEDSALRIFRLNPVLDGICAGTNTPYGNITDFKHKHNHFCNLSRIYKSRNDFLHFSITWSIWRWYSALNIFSKLHKE